MIKNSVFQFLINSIILIFLFSLNSCNNANNKYQKENELLQKIEGINITNNTNNIFILSESHCSPCNKKFSEFMVKNLKDENNIFIISASGNVIDISKFKDFKSKRVIILQKYVDDFFNKTKLLKLKNTTIDTIININIDTIDNYK